MFVYVTTYVDYDPVVAIKGLIGITLGISGIVMCSVDQLGVGLVFDASFTTKEFSSAVTTMILSFALILFANIVIQGASSFYESLTVIPVGATVFSLLIGINEEPFVHGWLLNLIENATEDTLAGAFVSSAIMAVIHLAIYGTRGWTPLIVVFVSFFLMGVAYAMSTENMTGSFRTIPVPCRRLSPIMNAHGLVNVTAGLRAASVILRFVAVVMI